MKWFRLLLALCFYPLWTAGQQKPPIKGYRLREVRRLHPAPLPTGGLVAFDDYFVWGLSDTTGRLYIRAVFEEEPEETAGPFWLSSLDALEKNEFRGDWWSERWGDSEVWINSRGQYLVVPPEKAAYQLADGSLVAKPYRRHLTKPLYRYQVLPHPDDPLALVPSPLRYWRNHRIGDVHNLGSGLFAVRGSNSTRYFSKRTKSLKGVPFHVPPSPGPPQAIFDSTGRRLTPYCYERLSTIRDGRIRYSKPSENWNSGYLNRRAQPILGPYSRASPFVQQHAIIQIRQGDTLKYAVIDTSGKYTIPPQLAELRGPDERGYIQKLHSNESRWGIWQFLLPNGQPLFPGRYFGPGEGFIGDSAVVSDTLNHLGILYLSGEWRFGVSVNRNNKSKPPQAHVEFIGNGRVALVNQFGQRVTTATYAKAHVLAGGWFIVYSTPQSPVQLLTPTGVPVSLPADYVPDLRYHGIDAHGNVPFQNGVIKVRWGKPYKFSGEPRREAYLTRGGRILTSDTKP